jgi:hypothetical protein
MIFRASGYFRSRSKASFGGMVSKLLFFNKKRRMKIEDGVQFFFCNQIQPDFLNFIRRATVYG